MMRRMSDSSNRSGQRGTTSSTVILFSVTVPVLSTQRTSTRASVSMQPMSWTRVRFCARRTTPAARAMLVSR